MNFLKSESYRSGVIQSIILNVLSKAVTFFNTVLITYYFGVTLQTDIYYYIFSIIALIAGFITVINGAVLIPQAMRFKEAGSEDQAMGYINRYTFWHTIAGILVALVLLLIPELIFGSISKFKAAELQQHRGIILMLVFLLPLMIITQHLKDILGMYKYFSLTIILTIINSICSIAFLLIFSGEANLVYAVAGLLLGYLINFALQGYIVIKKIKWKFTFQNVRKGPKNSAIYLWYFSNLISLPCASIYLYLIPSLGHGYLTAYSLALQVSLIPVQFILMQIIAVLSIKFNELYAKKEQNQVRVLFNDSTDFTLFLMTGMAALVFINSNEIISILFKRGNFTEESARLTAYFLQFMSLTLPFLVLANFTSILLMASQQVKKAFAYQVSANLLMVALCAMGFYFWKANGFLLGLVVYHVMNNIIMKTLFSEHRFIEYNRALKNLFLYLLICGLIGWLVLSLPGLFQPANIYLAIVVKTLVFVTVLIFAVYIFSLNKVFFSEVNRLFAALKLRYSTK